MALVPISPQDHVLGSTSAPLTLVEYGDYQCAVCMRAYGAVNRILTYFGPKVCFVFRHFPLSQAHPMAAMAAEAAEFAAEHGKFWEMHNLLFTNQEPLSLQRLQTLVESLNLSKEELAASIEQKKYSAQIEKYFEEGAYGGVNGSPTFFINTKRYDGPIANMGAYMDELLA